jgi:hypothetical protein
MFPSLGDVALINTGKAQKSTFASQELFRCQLSLGAPLPELEDV